MRGICYERLGNWDKAEKDFIESLKLKRNSPDVLNYLAYGWIERDMKIDESFVMLTDAHNANPDSHYILDSLAWVYFKKKNYFCNSKTVAASKILPFFIASFAPLVNVASANSG